MALGLLLLPRVAGVETPRLVCGLHLQRVLQSPNQTTAGYPAIQFSIDPSQDPPARFARLAFHARWNRWNGSKRPQLVVVATVPETRRLNAP